MKKKVYISLIIINVFLIVVNIVLTINLFNPNNPTKIFNNNIESIVEIKASSESVGESFGTGIIYSNDGYVITNAHVISYKSHSEENVFDNIQIRFTKDEDYKDVTFIKKDSNLDLAILKINDINIKYKPITISKDKYSYGDLVYAIGNTSNYGIGISQGIISVPEVKVTYDDISRLVIQSDIDISSGNSGGALLDEKGNLIGITTFRSRDSKGNVNYGFVFSIPIRVINEFINK